MLLTHQRWSQIADFVEIRTGLDLKYSKQKYVANLRRVQRVEGKKRCFYVIWGRSIIYAAVPKIVW